MFYWLNPDYSKDVRENTQQFLQTLTQPKNSDEYYAKAAAFEFLGQHKAAADCLRLSLQQNLCYIPALYALALKAFQKFEERDGMSYFKRAVRLDKTAAEHALQFQKELKFTVSSYEDASRWGVWCLKELEIQKKTTTMSNFQLGKTYFEQSRFQDAVPYLRQALLDENIASEASEYLSYIFEHLYRGDELVLKTLELAREIPNRADLFFNLAMVCQHEQKRLELALHFFYLAHREDPNDPGLRFSLEQAALEVIGDNPKNNKAADPVLLMFAHLYQGSVGMAKLYASRLQAFEFPHSFVRRQPEMLWREWLLEDDGVLGDALKSWFGEAANKQVLEAATKQNPGKSAH